MHVLVRALFCAALLTLAPGCCLMLGNTNTARPVEKGVAELGLTFGATAYQFETTTVDDPDTAEDEGGEKENLNVTYPVILPEIPFSIGITDNVAVGARVAPQSLGLEGNVKWTFLSANGLHMAIMPAFGYQSWLLVQGAGGKLPLLVTMEINRNLSFTSSVHAGYTKWSLSDEDFEPDEDDDRNQGVWNGELLSFGMGAGIELRGESFFFRPTFEFNRYQSNFADEFEDDFEPFNSYGFMLNFGFFIGQTKKQLDRIERKIDNLGPQPAPPPPPPPSPNEQALLPPSQQRWLPPTPEPSAE